MPRNMHRSEGLKSLKNIEKSLLGGEGVLLSGNFVGAHSPPCFHSEIFYSSE